MQIEMEKWKMEKYMKVIILLSMIIGVSVGVFAYDYEVAVGDPFVQADVYGEFDYIKLSNREFTMYLTEFDSHYRESLGWFSADYQEIDVVVVIDGIEYERSMFCHKEGLSELEVESATIVFSYYMVENVYTSRALWGGIIVAAWIAFMSGMILYLIGGVIQILRFEALQCQICKK